MKSMDVEIREINIKDACLQHFKDIGHDPSIHDITYENRRGNVRKSGPVTFRSWHWAGVPITGIICRCMQ